MKKLIAVMILGVALLALSVSPAKADTIGTLTLSGCGSGGSGCPDATYSFDISTTSATLTITINSAPTAGVNDRIAGVDLGFTPSGNISGLSLTGNPGGTWDTVTAGSLSNSGCGSNSGAFVCASSSLGAGDGVAISLGGTYSWTWTFNAINANNIFSVGDVHIGANYDPHRGLIVSETGATTKVPEPASILLLGAGLIGLAALALRRA
jgi:hypothetical protein